MAVALRAAWASGATWVRAFFDEPTGALVLELGGVGPRGMKNAGRVLHGQAADWLVVSTDGNIPLMVRRPGEHEH